MCMDILSFLVKDFGKTTESTLTSEGKRKREKGFSMSCIATCRKLLFSSSEAENRLRTSPAIYGVLKQVGVQTPSNRSSFFLFHAFPFPSLLTKND